MEYDQQTYLVENEYDDVKGFTVLCAKNGRYHLAEKWLASGDSGSDSGEASSPSEDRWIDYWIPEGDLLERVENGKCEKKAALSESQFKKVCQLSGQDYHKEEITQTA